MILFKKFKAYLSCLSSLVLMLNLYLQRLEGLRALIQSTPKNISPSLIFSNMLINFYKLRSLYFIFLVNIRSLSLTSDEKISSATASRLWASSNTIVEFLRIMPVPFLVTGLII